jgi:hypothetical protein
VPRLRATANATVHTARRRSASPRQLANQSGEHGRDALAVGRIAAAMRKRAARRARSSFAAACPGGGAPPAPRRGRRLAARSSASAKRTTTSSRSGSARPARAAARWSSRARACRSVPRSRQDRERGVDEARRQARAVRIFRRRHRPPGAGVVAGVRERRARPVIAGIDWGRPAALLEGAGRRLRVTERGQQLGVGGQGRVCGAAAGRRGALGAGTKPLRRRARPSRPASFTRRRATSSSSGRSSSARSAVRAARSNPVRGPPSPRGPAPRQPANEQGRDEQQAPHHEKIAPARLPPARVAAIGHKKNRPPSAAPLQASRADRGL